ncbi:hypothetical protein [Alicyclobacillus vulcanalis]|uniref:Uncharacterized protein n=1 Tax=Alicyclobacillus vulcanalis TaxID=252246 RepID=A0A1N7MR62_9BACL|nr:hypothetical protein [Alicyclobacillus vulcanalis]SIS88550.1 hypothetical protein SAMN05421799_10644 [Alicyclobacillus vulcanalis]
MERKKHPGGRPTKLTPELQKKICDAIRAGAYIETAAAYAGVNKTTLYDWLRRGARSKSGIYREFSDAIEKALAEAEMRDLLIIGKAAEENWQAAAWRLERKFPERWGRKDRMTVDAHHTGEVKMRVEYVAEWGADIDGGEGEDERAGD